MNLSDEQRSIFNQSTGTCNRLVMLACSTPKSSIAKLNPISPGTAQRQIRRGGISVEASLGEFQADVFRRNPIALRSTDQMVEEALSSS